MEWKYRCGNKCHLEDCGRKIVQKFTLITQGLNYERNFFQEVWHKIGFFVNCFFPGLWEKANRCSVFHSYCLCIHFFKAEKYLT